MITKELSEAAVEVNCILRNSTTDIIQKIPLKFIKLLKTMESKSYKFEYDKTKTLNEQNLKPETRGLIALIYQEYICNEEEKKIYSEKCNAYYRQKEILKRQMYNPDKVFDKNNETLKKAEIELLEDTQILEVSKESIWQKIIRTIKNKILKK